MNWSVKDVLGRGESEIVCDLGNYFALFLCPINCASGGLEQLADTFVQKCDYSTIFPLDKLIKDFNVSFGLGYSDSMHL